MIVVISIINVVVISVINVVVVSGKCFALTSMHSCLHVIDFPIEPIFVFLDLLMLSINLLVFKYDLLL